MALDSIGGIALIGEPGSGKSAIAAELAELLEWEELSFAGQLKSDVAMMLAHQAFSFDIDSRYSEWFCHLEAMAAPATKDKYRPLLQAYGSYRRAEHEDYWLERALRAMSPNSKYVIDDCRYMNEYEALRARNFQFVYLQPGPTTRGMTDEQAAHESEQDWRKFMVVIDLTYEAGPKHQAERIIHMLQNRVSSTFADDLAPFKKQTREGAKALAPKDVLCPPCGVPMEECEQGAQDCLIARNCDCDGCVDGEDVAVDSAARGRSVYFLFPSGSVISYSEYGDDETVVAVPI